MEILPGAVPPSQLPLHAGLSADGESVEPLYQLPTPVVLRGDAIRIPPQQVERILVGIRRSRSFTVVARVTPDDLLQSGPAPIVSFSRDHIYRNFDLGQEGERIVFRVRNPLNVIDQDFRIESNPLALHKSLSIVATYDGTIAKLFINGSLQARENTAAIVCASRDVCDSGVPVGWSILGGVSVLVGLALFPVRTRTSLVLIAAICSVVAVLLPRSANLIPAAVLSSQWLQVCAALGAVSVVLARALSQDAAAIS